MILRSFGCSFIFGTDLHDDGRDFKSAMPSNYTWPALLANHCNLSYRCHARAGSGNLQILQKILTQAPIDNLPVFYVIGWTWIDRFDYSDREPSRINKWRTLMPIESTSVAHNYYRDLHSQYRDKLTNLVYIKTAIDTLQQHKIPFVMTYMDDLLFETQWHSDLSIQYLQQCVKPHLKQFDGKNFLDWSKDQGFEISATMHPLEAAHQAASEYARDHFLV